MVMDNASLLLIKETITSFVIVRSWNKDFGNFDTSYCIVPVIYSVNILINGKEKVNIFYIYFQIETLFKLLDNICTDLQLIKLILPSLDRRLKVNLLRKPRWTAIFFITGSTSIKCESLDILSVLHSNLALDLVKQKGWKFDLWYHFLMWVLCC